MDRLEGKQTTPKDESGVSGREEDGDTPLHSAALHGRTNTVQRLLQAGATVDAANKDDKTPLHHASRYGHMDTVQMLLQAGAKVDATDKDGQTPLYYAARIGHTDTVQVFLHAGAQVDATNKCGSTPLHTAAWDGHADTVQQLIHAGAKVDAIKKYSGDTPLHNAARNGDTDTVQVLLHAGANVDATNKHGSTPLHWAAYNGHTATLKMLLHAGAKLDVKSKNGQTPLEIAMLNDHTHIAELLIQGGADVSKVNQEYQKKMLQSGFITKDMLQLGYGGALSRLQERIKKGATLPNVRESFQKMAKSILLGLVGSGKTSLLQTMIANESNLTNEIDRTVGFEVHGMELTQECKVWWYDSGGHQSYHHTNQLFLSPFSLFNVVVDLSEYKTDQAYFDKAVGYWINITTNRVPSPVIKIVATHMEEDICSKSEARDRCDDIIKRMHANEDRIKCGLKNRLDQIYSAIDSKMKNGRATGVYSGVSLAKLEKIKGDVEFLLSHRPELPEEIICVSSKTKEGIEQFKSLVAETISSHPGKFPTMSIPTVWLKIEEELVNARAHSTYLTLEEFHQLTSKHGINPDSEIFDEMIVYFQITGTIIYYDIPELKEYVFHHPHWILQTLGHIFHHNLQQFEEMPSKVLQEFEKLPPKEREILLKNLQERAWIGKDLLKCLLVEFNPDEKLLSALEALLMKFDICYKLHQDEIKDPVARQCGPYLCIPALAPDELSSDDEEMMWPNKLPEGMSEYHMVLQFESQWLPAELFGIIAVRFSKHVTSRLDWKGGFVGIVRKDITIRVTEYHDEEGNVGLVFAMRAPKGCYLRYSEGMVLVLHLNELVLFYPGAHSMLVVQCSECLLRSSSDSSKEVPIYHVHTDVFLSEDSHTIEFLKCPNCKNLYLDPKVFFPVDLTGKGITGGMTKEHQHALRKNRVALLNDMDTMSMMTYIISKDIFNERTEQEIQSKSTRYDRNEALLDFLPRFGDQAFFAFCEALQHAKQTHLVELLTKDVVEDKEEKDRCVIA